MSLNTPFTNIVDMGMSDQVVKNLGKYVLFQILIIIHGTWSRYSDKYFLKMHRI